MDLLVKPVEERVQRLNAARDSMLPLLEGELATRSFQNECETVFSKFRLTVMHLRKEQDALSAIEKKEVVTRFVGLICKERPFLHDRCEEVLRILMLSDEWMEAFMKEAELDPDNLPPGIKDEFKKRLDEVKEKEKDPAKDPDKKQPGAKKEDVPRDPWSRPPQEKKDKPLAVPSPDKPLFPGHGVAGAMRVVVQRCSKAKLMVDEFGASWDEIGCGLFVAVSFVDKADDERIQYAARFLLTAKLSTSGQASSSGYPGNGPRGSPGHGDADSVVNLCNKGEEQSIMVIPQASLDSAFEETKDDENPFNYPHRAKRENAERMYNLLVESLKTKAKELVPTGVLRKGKPPRIVASSFTGRQSLEMTSAGPFMHTFVI